MRLQESGNNVIIGIIRGLFLFKGLVWTAFGLIFYVRFRTPLAPFLSILMLIDAAIFLWLAWAFGRRKAWVFYFSLAFLIANLILTVTDQMGIYDFIVLAIDAAVLLALILARNKILPVSK